MDSSMRYFGCAVGFGFGLVWMTVGLGSALLCGFLAALGYAVVFVSQRARDEAVTTRWPRRTSEAEAQDVTVDPFELDRDPFYEPQEDLPDDATSPLAAEADYGWPIQRAEVARTEDA
jgi:hypothetical protein